MKTSKTITLLGKELTISQTYESRGYGLTETIEAIEIDTNELTSLITSEEDAEQLAEEMSEYAYNEVYNVCKEAAKRGEPLYSNVELAIWLPRSGRISATAMYSEENECSKIGISSYIEEREEEDEDGNKIPENVRFNELVSAFEACEFSRKMSDRELIDFERLEDEARANYRRLHPEEFDEEEDN